MDSITVNSRFWAVFLTAVVVVSSFIYKVSAADPEIVGEPRSVLGEEGGHNNTCIFYHELKPDQQCSFIKDTDDCQPDSGFFNYLEFTYCSFSASLQPLALIILFIWLTFLFASLGVTAKNFFCPTLITISKVLKLNENVAGVTFLAFGNGSPDVFSAVAAITNSKDGDAGLAIGALFGAAVFITTFVAGTISFLGHFDVAQIPFLRDAIFFVGASYWTFYILYTGEIWTSEAVGFILLYICYVGIVLVARKFGPADNLNKPMGDSCDNLEDGIVSVTPEDITSNVDNPRENLVSNEPNPVENVFDGPKEDSFNSKSNPTDNKYGHSKVHLTSDKPNFKDGIPEDFRKDDIKEKNESKDNVQKKPEEDHTYVEPKHKEDAIEKPVENNFSNKPNCMENGNEKPNVNFVISDKKFNSIDIVPENPEEFTGANPEEQPLLSKKRRPTGCGYQLKELARAVNPIDVKGWKTKSFIMRFFEIYKSPIKLLLQITVPVVLYDKSNWNKLLNCFQLLIGPLWCVVITKAYDTAVAGEFYLWELMLIVGALLAILAAFTSKTNAPPIYYMAFAFLGFVISVCWIFSIANEIVNLLRMYGMVFDLSNAILGLTFLAWGNCIGDLVADTAMARQGAPRMAISACFGGPIFNMLIGIGISCTIATTQNGGIFKLKTDALQFVLAAGLGISLFTSMFFMIAARFRATRVYAVMLYIFYAVFLTVAILTETKVIKW